MDQPSQLIAKKGFSAPELLPTFADFRPAAATAGHGKPGLTLIKLFEIVKANMPKPHYEVYDIAEKYGHIIIFTPPYSPLSNPIEKIWAVTKNRIATSEERASNLSELAALLEGAVESITQKTWLGCYKKTREWEDMDLFPSQLLKNAEPNCPFVPENTCSSSFAN